MGSSRRRWLKPIDPFERRVLDGFEAAPGSAPPDYLGFIETVDRLGQSVVVAVADTADRWLDAGLGKALCVLDGHVLRPTIAIMDQGHPEEVGRRSWGACSRTGRSWRAPSR